MRASPLLSCISWTLLLVSSIAAEPKIEHLYPAAGQQGTTVSITATGKITPWPPQIWADTEGLTFKPAKTAPKFEVEIAKDAAPGPHLVRFFGDHGPSAPYFFIVSRDSELLDTEPNDDFKSPQKIAALPATISGRLDKAGDVDSFAVTLHAGQTLVAWVEAYVLASTFDAMLRIVDSSGNEVAFNQDGRNLDPFLAWKAPRDGTYIVQLMGFVYPPGSDVRFAGGDSDVYRLHLTTGPFVHWTVPLAVQRGKTTSVQLIGWNLDTPRAEIDASQFPPSATSVDLPLPGVLSDQPLLVSDIPELIATTDEKGAPQALEIPCAVTGRIRAGWTRKPLHLPRHQATHLRPLDHRRPCGIAPRRLAQDRRQKRKGSRPQRRRRRLRRPAPHLDGAGRRHRHRRDRRRHASRRRRLLLPVFPSRKRPPP